MRSPAGDERGAGRNGPDVVLASASPRRRVLLAMLEVDGRGLVVEAVDAGVDEAAVAAGLNPLEAVLALARAKALAVEGAGRPVMGADTVVVLGGEILGKPDDRAHAEQMLWRQSGAEVQVISAVALATPDAAMDDRVAVSTLRVDQLDDATIAAYLATGEADDKAGALAVQGGAGCFVTIVDGTRSNVVGLPLAETVELLRGAGIHVQLPAPGRL